MQRVSEAGVTIAGRVVAEIGPGLLVLAGFGVEDGAGAPETPAWKKLCAKVPELRIFPDDEGKLNKSLQDTGGGLLLVPQFTLHADCRKGRRPSFHLAAPPGTGVELFKALVGEMERLLPGRVRQGVFGAEMDVALVNRGPVTIILDSADLGA
jgi:D-tyrosyl-tRNA(Tyr) deacylase